MTSTKTSISNRLPSYKNYFFQRKFRHYNQPPQIDTGIKTRTHLFSAEASVKPNFGIKKGQNEKVSFAGTNYKPAYDMYI